SGALTTAVTTAMALSTGARNGAADSSTGPSDAPTGTPVSPAGTVSGGTMRARGAPPWSRPISGILTCAACPDIHHEVVERDRSRQQIGQHTHRIIFSPDEI